MKQIVVGMVAHVDAGKTTLSEGLLYESKMIRTLGRVDKKDAFLDTYSLEKLRGITIFSKEARIKLDDMCITLLDTPGHVDFCAEMERTLQVLDYAVLVISSTDNVTGHTKTLWHLLNRYKIPVFIFVNKMDMDCASKEVILTKLKNGLDNRIVDFTKDSGEAFLENIAENDEKIFGKYMNGDGISTEEITTLIDDRKIFPCMFGSALKLDGVKEFFCAITKYTSEKKYPKEFGARVYKISRDDAGNRVTHMKITGGSLSVRDIILEEKVSQVRIYSGNRYDAVSKAVPGELCVVTGLNNTMAGMGLGIEENVFTPELTPVLKYAVLFPAGTDISVMYGKLKQLEEEEPELHIVYDEELKELQAELMGEVQIDILKSIIKDRFGVDAEFGTGNIVYKETISNEAYGVGHFEPLRHYAEVHVILSPGENGSGITFESRCSEDVLDKNWQRLIKTHVYEKEHRGVLVGAPLTDVHVTLVAGRAHNKHTEGGDFRQATYRAIRQGLMEAESVLLEPYYEYVLNVPSVNVGRAITDIEAMCGTYTIIDNNGDETTLTGKAPVACMRDYQREVQAYTRGFGRLSCKLSGYGKCHNSEEVIASSTYDPLLDRRNETSSVFCANGSGFIVPWNEVKQYMHIEVKSDNNTEISEKVIVKKSTYEEELSIGTDEIDKILNRTYNANKRETNDLRYGYLKKKYEPLESATNVKLQERLEQYMLVDGYNVIFAWDELNELARENVDASREKLIDILSNYQGMKKNNIIVVFDAYRVKGHNTEFFTYHNINVVYTKEAETADSFIERFAHDNKKKYDITVVTSDGLEQIIIRGQGCRLISSREFKEEIEYVNKQIREEYLKK